MIGRGTETMEVIEQRMQRAIEESDGMESYDYYVINDDLDTCVDEVHRIIQAEHNRSTRNHAFAHKIKRDLKGE